MRRHCAGSLSVLRVAASVCTACLFFATAARASNTLINFDDLPAGTQVTNQYAAQGVTFGQDVFGQPQTPPVVYTPGAGQAHSAPNVAIISRCFVEICAQTTNGFLTNLASHVDVWVGEVDLIASNHIELCAYDSAGNQIGSCDTINTGTAEGVVFDLGVSSPNHDIASFALTVTGSPSQLAMDDLSFDVPDVPPPPDFSLSRPGATGTVDIATGRDVPVGLRLHRLSGSAGAIAFSVYGLPPGVRASFSPSEATGSADQNIVMDLHADLDAPPGPATITVIGTPLESTAGTAARALQVPINVVGPVDLRAQGIDVTQGVQQTPLGVLIPSGGGSGLGYRGVDLVAGKKTVVRVFADAHGSPPAGVPGVGALLHGFRNGVELPDSPLGPDYGPQSLPDTGEANPAPVLLAELESDKNAFTFTLPASWTSGTIQLVAEVTPPPPSFTFLFNGCTSAACRANDSFTLNDVAFSPVKTFTLTTLGLTVNGTFPISADQVFTDARAVVPLSDQGFVVTPYQAILVVAAKDSNNASAIQGMVAQWDANNGSPGDGTIGVVPTGTNGLTSGRESEVDFSPTSGTADDRPLTSVAHELFHQFGLPHASNECGGGQDGDSDDGGKEIGEPWLPLAPAPGEPGENPPDDGIGQLDSIGLDTTSEPYKILADGLGGIAQYYDFMSYCSATRGFGDAGNWVSWINWEAVFDHFKTGTARDVSSAAGAGGPPASVASLHRSRIRVIGVVSRNGTQITSVGPQIGPAPPAAGSNSAFTLVARDAAGKSIASTPMSFTPGHADFVGPSGVIEGTVPAAAVDSIEVVSNGKVVARRKRPARAPRLRVIAPRRGTRVGGARTVLVRWTASSPEHLALTASVDYSGDDGGSWRTIFIGPDRGRAALPSFYFVGSRRARVRVRVNDGFNETAVVSAPFIAVGAAPQVTILSPAPRARVGGDATLPLSGEAFDQRLRRLPGRSLRWFDGPFSLGRGATLISGALPPGTNRIRLLASADGHTGSATVVVDVRPVRLPFLKLKVPARVSRRAKTLTLTAASAIPAVLSIDRVNFKLTRRPRTLRLRVTPGRGPLLLRMRVVANGISTPFAAEVRR